MHEPEFEKKVQQKMEELEFSPSDVVWMNLERRIGRKKRRRLPLFWLFFLPGLLLGAAGAYLILTPSAHTPVTAAHSSSQAAGTVATSAPAGVASGNSIARPDPARPGSTSPGAAANVPAGAPVSTPGLAHDPASNSALHRSLTPAGHPALRNPGAILRSGPDPIAGRAVAHNVPDHRNAFGHTTKKSSASTQADPASPSTTIPLDETTTTFAGTTGSSSPGSAAESSLHRSPTGDIVPLGAGMNADAASRGATNRPVYPKWAKDGLVASSGAPAKKAKPYKASRWSAGFTGGGGLSSIHQPSSGHALAYSAPSAQYSSLTGVNIAAAAPNYVPDPVRPDFSFWAGIFAQRPVSDRVSLSVGLNLHYYSAIISTGKQVINPPIASPSYASLFYYSAPVSPGTSLAYPYYPTGTGSKFTNQYYFLELPLALQWQLNRSRKIPVFWEGGLSVSRLMSADALYYDGKMGVYYKNKGNNEQTQLNVSTALMVGLNNGAASRMQLGPQLQYGLTSLNSGISGQHLWYGGIKFTLVLGPGRSLQQGR